MHSETEDLSQSVISLFLDVTSLASAVAAMRVRQVEEQLQYWMHWTVFDPVGVNTDQPMDLRTRAEIADLRAEAEHLGFTINPQPWRPFPGLAHAAIDWCFEESHVYGRTAFIALAKAYWATTTDIRDEVQVVECLHRAGLPTRGLAHHLGLKSTMQAQFQNLARIRAAHIGDTPVLKANGTLLPGLLDPDAYIQIIETMGTR